MIKHLWKILTNTKYRETFVLYNKIKRKPMSDEDTNNFWMDLKKHLDTKEKDTQPK